MDGPGSRALPALFTHQVPINTSVRPAAHKSGASALAHATSAFGLPTRTSHETQTCRLHARLALTAWPPESAARISSQGYDNHWFC
ncbi:Hypp7122 [Branchiostoma lanceolatum]|uniref:Hypp7122 protein n=1 Tax=Branchiostoma lanceolatum TaxID=7740 RepID=A0A8K0EBU1_BRALA|nr:Hypp7122 [Branchiostoma lanceolatum]